MAKIEDGASGAILAAVDAGNKALRISSRPLDCLGHYRYSGATGILGGMGAYSELFQLRWTDPDVLALVQFVRVSCIQIAPFTTPQELGVEVRTTQSVTEGGAGGWQLLPTAQSFKKRSDMPQSRAAELRIATTGPLGVGTRVVSPFPMLSQYGWAGGAGQTIVDTSMDLSSGGAEYPLVLMQNESLIVRNGPTTLAAGGSARFCVEVAWAEIAAESF